MSHHILEYPFTTIMVPFLAGKVVFQLYCAWFKLEQKLVIIMRDIIKLPKNACNFNVINSLNRNSMNNTLERWLTTFWGICNCQPYIFCKRVGAYVDECALIVYLPHGYRENWSFFGIRMLRSSVISEKPVTYALGAVISLHLSFRYRVIRKLVLEKAKS